MTEKTARARNTRLTLPERMHKYGFYASTFTAEELRYLEADSILGRTARYLRPPAPSSPCCAPRSCAWPG